MKKKYLDMIKLASLEVLIQAGLILLIINVIESAGIGMIYVSHNLRSDMEIGIAIIFIIMLSLFTSNILFQLPFILKLIKKKNRTMWILLISIIESFSFLLIFIGISAFTGSIGLIWFSFQGYVLFYSVILLAMIISNMLNIIYLK